MRFLKNIALVIAAMLLLTGCTTGKTVTFNVETGDTIKIRLDTTNGFNIDEKVPFTITENGTAISVGKFVTLEGYNQFVSAGKGGDPNASAINEGTKNGITWLFYKYEDEDGKEYNYIITVNGSKTGIIISNVISQESAQACFDRLTFTKE